MKVISDNVKTFKLANKFIQSVIEDPDVSRHFSDLRIEWSFNLERALGGRDL